MPLCGQGNTTKGWDQAGSQSDWQGGVAAVQLLLGISPPFGDFTRLAGL